jgi:hypothetical protein
MFLWMKMNDDKGISSITTSPPIPIKQHELNNE